MQKEDVINLNYEIAIEVNNLTNYLVNVYIYKYPTADFQNRKYELLVGFLDGTMTPHQREILRCQKDEFILLRKKIIDTVAETLLFSDHFLSTGYYRSKKFLEEFNIFYSLGITDEDIERKIDAHHKKRVRELTT